MKRNDGFDAISDPIRRLLLEEIRRSPKTVNELCSGLTITRPAVSQHLRALRESGLVTVTALGAKRYYAVNNAGFLGLNLWLDQFWSKTNPMQRWQGNSKRKRQSAE
jgi:DNA-binding transcriptional ArsR family regulator